MLMTTAMMIGSMTVSAFADENVDVAYQGGLAAIDTSLDTTCGYGNEWEIITLARAGQLSYEKAEKYYASLEEELIDNGGSGAGTTQILAVVAIGKDPKDVAGYNLLEPYGDMDYVIANGWGIYASINALWIFDSKNYDIPDVAASNKTTREALINNLLTTDVIATGGWGWSTDMDIDETAMVIQALAPYYNSNIAVKTAIDKALDALSSVQNADGSFSGSSSACTTGQVLLAISSLGIDAKTDARFVKGGKTMLDALQGFYIDGLGFGNNTGDVTADSYATKQVTYSLCAYNRFVAGKNAFYNMTDATPIKPTTTEATTAEAPTTEATTAVAKKDSTPTTGDSMPVAALVSIVIVAVGGAIVTTRKQQIK